MGVTVFSDCSSPRLWSVAPRLSTVSSSVRLFRFAPPVFARFLPCLLSCAVLWPPVAGAGLLRPSTLGCLSLCSGVGAFFFGSFFFFSVFASVLLLRSAVSFFFSFGGLLSVSLLCFCPASPFPFLLGCFPFGVVSALAGVFHVFLFLGSCLRALCFGLLRMPIFFCACFPWF